MSNPKTGFFGLRKNYVPFLTDRYLSITIITYVNKVSRQGNQLSLIIMYTG
jgi:hypothetical protein